MNEQWYGHHLLLVPLIAWKSWTSKLGQFDRVITWDAGTQLFVDSSSGQRKWVPTAEDVQWAVFRLSKDA